MVKSARGNTLKPTIGNVIARRVKKPGAKPVYNSAHCSRHSSAFGLPRPDVLEEAQGRYFTVAASLRTGIWRLARIRQGTIALREPPQHRPAVKAGTSAVRQAWPMWHQAWQLLKNQI